MSSILDVWEVENNGEKKHTMHVSFGDGTWHFILSYYNSILV